MTDVITDERDVERPDVGDRGWAPRPGRLVQAVSQIAWYGCRDSRRW